MQAAAGLCRKASGGGFRVAGADGTAMLHDLPVRPAIALDVAAR
jgi:hypothetical protein